MSREALRDGCLEVERTVYSARNTLKRLWKSGTWNVPVLLANQVYSARVRKRGDLLPDEPTTESVVSATLSCR